MYSVVTGRCLRKAQAHHPTYPCHPATCTWTWQKRSTSTSMSSWRPAKNRHRCFFLAKKTMGKRRILMEINTNLSKPQQSSPTPDPWNTGQIFPYRNHRSGWCHWKHPVILWICVRSKMRATKWFRRFLMTRKCPCRTGANCVSQVEHFMSHDSIDDFQRKPWQPTNQAPLFEDLWTQENCDIHTSNCTVLKM